MRYSLVHILIIQRVRTVPMRTDHVRVIVVRVIVIIMNIARTRARFPIVLLRIAVSSVIVSVVLLPPANSTCAFSSSRLLNGVNVHLIYI